MTLLTFVQADERAWVTEQLSTHPGHGRAPFAAIFRTSRVATGMYDLIVCDGRCNSADPMVCASYTEAEHIANTMATVTPRVIAELRDAVEEHLEAVRPLQVGAFAMVNRVASDRRFAREARPIAIVKYAHRNYLL